MYVVWTDGSYKSSINAGGWSSIVTKDSKIIAKLYQGFTNTTNNRMELRAVLETLKYFNEPETIKIISDSKYVINNITKGYVYEWFKLNDYSKKNLDLWFEIINLLDFHNVTFEWVKGHEDDYFNNMADLYAQHVSECLNLKEDLSIIKTI